MLQEFELGKVLGEGNYAQVKLSKEKATGHMWAIKVINKKKLEVCDRCSLTLLCFESCRVPWSVRSLATRRCLRWRSKCCANCRIRTSSTCISTFR